MHYQSAWPPPAAAHVFASLLVVSILLCHAAASPFDSSAGRLHRLLKRDITLVGCTDTQKSLINAALTDSRNMAAAAAQRTTQLYNWITTDPTSLSALSPLQYSTLKTYESLFGQVYFGAGDDAGNEAALERLTIMSLFADVMEGELAVQPSLNVQIHCNEDYLSTTDPDGNSKAGFMFDSLSETWLKASGKPCVQNPNRMAYTLSYPVILPETEVAFDLVVLCPQWFGDWTSQAGTTLTSIATQTFNPATNPKTLESLTHALSRVVLHELSHCGTVTGDSRLSDETCENAQTAYNFLCVVQLATQSPDKAIENADSYTLYALAMYLSNNDWSTGNAEPLVAPP